MTTAMNSMDEGVFLQPKGKTRKRGLDGDGPLPTAVRLGRDEWATDAQRRAKERAEARALGSVEFYRITVNPTIGLLGCGHTIDHVVMTPFAFCDRCYCERLRQVIEF